MCWIGALVELSTGNGFRISMLVAKHGAIVRLATYEIPDSAWIVKALELDEPPGEFHIL